LGCNQIQRLRGVKRVKLGKNGFMVFATRMKN